jgi:hypothetical protein
MCHGKSKFITAKANPSRQKQIHHGKSKLPLSSRASLAITHGNKLTSGVAVSILPRV